MNEETTLVRLDVSREDERPIQTNEVISAKGPTMPPLLVNVDLEDRRFSVISLVYECSLTYKENGRNDQAGPFNGQGVNNVLIDWGGTVHGGDLSGRVNVHIRRPNGTNYWSGWQNLLTNIKLVGENPSQTDVITESKEIQAVVIATKKSGLRMFTGGMPYYVDASFGLFLLSSPLPAQIWNWKENVAAGIAQFKDLQTKTSEYPGSLRTAEPQKYKGLPDYDSTQLKMETYQSYSIDRYWVPKKRGFIFKKWVWEKSKSVNDFADECLRIETGMPT